MSCLSFIFQKDRLMCKLQQICLQRPERKMCISDVLYYFPKKCKRCTDRILVGQLLLTTMNTRCAVCSGSSKSTALLGLSKRSENQTMLICSPRISLDLPLTNILSIKFVGEDADDWITLKAMEGVKCQSGDIIRDAFWSVIETLLSGIECLTKWEWYDDVGLLIVYRMMMLTNTYELTKWL